MSNVLRKLRWSIRQRGLLATLRVMLRRATSSQAPTKTPAQHPFDLKYSVDTGGLIGGGDLGSGHPHDQFITAYVAMSPSRFNASVERWLATPPLDAIERHTFIDLGCGKGRALMLASQWPFRQVVGVELDPSLAATATTNLDTWNTTGGPRQAVTVVCGDATEFQLPPGPALIYLANPFGAPVLRRLLQSLELRATSGGGTVDLLYQNAEQHAVFAEFPAFKPLWSAKFPLSAEDALTDIVYTNDDLCYAFRR